MPELTPQERLQPSLLDRLTDDAPHEQRESRDERVFSAARLRQVALRDLAWLLNTTNLACAQDLTAYPHVENSVVNYGIPELAGASSSGLDTEEVENAIREAILRFEPRLLRSTLRVRASAQTDEMNHQALILEITGDLWSQPLPQQLYLRTELDLETGEARLGEAGRVAEPPSALRRVS